VRCVRSVSLRLETTMGKKAENLYIQSLSTKIFTMTTTIMNTLNTNYYHDAGLSYALKLNELGSGTTILAVPYNGGVVVGADSRVSTGTYVANRASDKIAQISSTIFCLRSGSAADCQALTDHARRILAAVSLESGQEPRVQVAAHVLRNMMYQHKDQLSAGVIVAGYDATEGAVAYQIAQGGSCLKVPFAVGGSGSTYIYGLLDHSYQPNMTREAALELVKRSVSHAMARDGSSGGVVRTIVITADGFERGYTAGRDLPFGPVGY
jgi:20S proteasome subunit beta 1